jgi:predicted GNAT family acetyltransferase
MTLDLGRSRKTHGAVPSGLRMDEHEIANNTAMSQFELFTEGKTTVLQYRIQPGRIVFLHTEVPKEFEGKGIGSKLVRVGLKFASEQGLRVVPQCAFVAAYIRRHREFAGLVPPEYRSRVVHLNRSRPDRSGKYGK